MVGSSDSIATTPTPPSTPFESFCEAADELEKASGL